MLHYLIPVVVLGAWLAIKQPWRLAVAVAEPRAGGRKVEGAGWFGNYYPAMSGASRPGILVIGGSEGGLHPQVDRDARTLHRAGYSVLALSFFRGPGQGAELALVPIELFLGALDWLREQPEVDGARLGIIGMSKGAEAALLVASQYPDLAAVVAAVPSSVVWPGFDWSKFRGLKESSWSLGGKALTALPYGRMTWSKGVRSIYEAGLADLPAHPDTVIPVERSQAAILLICAGKDQVWPSCRMAEQVSARLLAHGAKPAVVLTYPDADHGVFASPLEAGDKPRRFGFGRPAEGNSQAQADSWQRTVQFLEESLA